MQNKYIQSKFDSVYQAIPQKVKPDLAILETHMNRLESKYISLCRDVNNTNPAILEQHYETEVGSNPLRIELLKILLANHSLASPAIQTTEEFAAECINAVDALINQLCCNK